MKILIAADMEGITGVINWDQVNPAHAEYPRFRKIMTEEVNAAISGVYEGGVDEVVVADGHAGGSNIMIELLDPRARLNSGNDAPYSMVQGIDTSIDGVIFIGYHARAGTTNAILDHTWSSRRVHNLWFNDILMGEYGVNAALCGHFGAPVIMLSGDQSVCAQAVELLGPIETVVVKQATSHFSAESQSTERNQHLIHRAAQRAIERLREGELKVFRLDEPIRVTIEFAHSEMADKAMDMPGLQRLDGRRITFVAPEMPVAYRAFKAAIALAVI